MRSVPPTVVGRAILDKHQSLLSSNLNVDRVHEAHRLVKASLDAVLPELKLYTFGSSSVFGFHEPKSDVDFVALRHGDIVDGKGGDSTSQLAKALQTKDLAMLAKHVRQHNLQWSVEEVRRARVPVVRVKAPHLDFDITAHRRNGVRNSALLHSYLVQQPANRWLSIAVKHWSKQTGMNGPMGYLTSYGFNILVVYYLLHSGQGRAAVDGSAASAAAEASPTEEGRGARLAELAFRDKDAFDVAEVDPIPAYLPLAPPDPEVLGTQVLDFLDFYLSRFPMATHVVTLDRMEPLTKEELQWTRTAEDMRNGMAQDKVFYRFCIQDPYEVNLNVGRNISSFKLDMMRKHFENGSRTALGCLPS